MFANKNRLIYSSNSVVIPAKAGIQWLCFTSVIVIGLYKSS